MAPFEVDVAARLARAERDPEDARVLERHRAGQGGHVAVVDHLERHAELVAQSQEQVVDFVKALLRHAAEERRDHRPVVDDDAGRAAADGVEPRQLRARQLQRRADVPVVVVRIGLARRLPDDLFAEDRLAVDDGRHLHVRSPEVEADPAAVEVAPQRLAGLARRRDLAGAAGDDRERPAVHLLAHEAVVERPGAVGRVRPRDVLADRRRPANRHLPAAARPQEELHEALGVDEVGFRARMAVGKRHGLESRHGAVRPLQADHERHALARRSHFAPERPVGQRRGSELGFQRWNERRRDESECRRHGIPHEAKPAVFLMTSSITSEK